MRFVTLFAAAFIAAITSTPALAKSRGPTVDDRIAACSAITEDRAYLACLTQVEEECGSFRRLSRRECEAAVGTARAEFERDVARGELAAAQRPATTGSGRIAAAGMAAPFSLELPTHRPRELVVHTTPPPGFAQCGSCVELYGLRPGDYLLFYVNGEMASVVGSAGGLDTVVADLDENGAIDAKEMVGVDIADGRKVSSVYLTLRPGVNTPVRVVRLAVDQTIPGGQVYVPVWETTHQVGNGSWSDRATPWRKNIEAGI